MPLANCSAPAIIINQKGFLSPECKNLDFNDAAIFHYCANIINSKKTKPHFEYGEYKWVSRSWLLKNLWLLRCKDHLVSEETVTQRIIKLDDAGLIKRDRIREYINGHFQEKLYLTLTDKGMKAAAGNYKIVFVSRKILPKPAKHPQKISAKGSSVIAINQSGFKDNGCIFLDFNDAAIFHYIALRILNPMGYRLPKEPAFKLISRETIQGNLPLLRVNGKRMKLETISDRIRKIKGAGLLLDKIIRSKLGHFETYYALTLKGKRVLERKFYLKYYTWKYGQAKLKAYRIEHYKHPLLRAFMPSLNKKPHG
jgi:hypothetical protein